MSPSGSWLEWVFSSRGHYVGRLWDVQEVRPDWHISKSLVVAFAHDTEGRFLRDDGNTLTSEGVVGT